MWFTTQWLSGCGEISRKVFFLKLLNTAWCWRALISEKSHLNSLWGICLLLIWSPLSFSRRADWLCMYVCTLCVQIFVCEAQPGACQSSGTLYFWKYINSHMCLRAHTHTGAVWHRGLFQLGMLIALITSWDMQNNKNSVGFCPLMCVRVRVCVCAADRLIITYTDTLLIPHLIAKVPGIMFFRVCSCSSLFHTHTHTCIQTSCCDEYECLFSILIPDILFLHV